MDSGDLIENLQKRGMDHILQQIFGYLDYYCLRRAELVSLAWQEAILDTKVWMKLLNRNIFLMPEWKKLYTILKGMKQKELGEQHIPIYYRKACCLIEAEQQLIERNWRNVKYFERQSELASNIHNDCLDFDVNGHWIVQRQPHRRILVRNRWTLQTEKILDIPIMQICWMEEKIPEIRTVKVNDHFIAISFFEHSEICVWNAQSKDLVVVLDGPSGDPIDGNDDIGNYSTEGFCLWDNMLLTCHIRSSDFKDWILTLRSVPSTIDGQVTLIYQNAIMRPAPLIGMFEITMDENYIVFFFLMRITEDEDTGLSQIEIRKRSSFEVVNHILFEDDTPFYFHYLNGLIVTGFSDTPIKIWNVTSSGDPIKIRYREALCAIRLVSDKYIVTCDDKGKVKVWDLQAAMKSSGKNANFVLKTIPPPQSTYFRHSFGVTTMAADEFQIALLASFDGSTSCVNVKNFFGETR